MSNWSFFVSLVSVILVVVGWLVIWRNAKLLATRSETYSFVCSVCADIAKIKEMSSDWCLGDGEPADKKLQLKVLKSEVRSLINSLNYLEKNRGVYLGDNRPFKLRVALTMDAEKLLSESNEEAALKKYSEIQMAYSDLSLELRGSFEQIYSPSIRK